MKYHRNLNKGIVDKINESEKAGGVFLKNIPANSTINIKTGNSLYAVHKTDRGETIKGHPEYCPAPVNCRINGSTFGGSMLKIGWIGIGMHLEVFLTDTQKTITTSAIETIEITTVDNENAGF